MISRINKDGARPVRLKPCKNCGSLGHTAFNCPKRPKKPMRAKRPMNKIGRITRKLIDQRKEYLKAFPAPHYCFYCLYVGVEEELDEKDVQVEHFMTKNNRQDLRFDWSNLVKSCAGHNADKGGMNGDKYLKKLDEARRSECEHTNRRTEG